MNEYIARLIYKISIFVWQGVVIPLYCRALAALQRSEREGKYGTHKMFGIVMYE